MVCCLCLQFSKESENKDVLEFRGVPKNMDENNDINLKTCNDEFKKLIYLEKCTSNFQCFVTFCEYSQLQTSKASQKVIPIIDQR